MDLNEVEHLVPREKNGFHLFLIICAIGLATVLLFLG